MNTLNRRLLALATVAAISSPALAAEEYGPYIGLGFGLHEAINSTVSAQIPIGTAAQNRVTFDTGWAAHGAVGYKWPQDFRSEFEVGYRNATVGTIAGANWLGRQSAVTLMGNLLYDVGAGTTFQPYVGGGVGFAITKWDGVQATGSPNFTDRSSKFQWQGIVGVTVPL
jgi:OmpA-OmpF porin, OOP family